MINIILYILYGLLFVLGAIAGFFIFLLTAFCILTVIVSIHDAINGE